MPESVTSLASKVRRLEAKMAQLERVGMQPRAFEGLLDGGEDGDVLINRGRVSGEQKYEWGKQSRISPWTVGKTQVGSKDYIAGT